MRDNKSLLLCVCALCLGAKVQAQGTFQNLGFESATLVPIPGDPYARVQFAAALPGWTCSIGGVQQTAALYDNFFLDSSGVGVIDQGWSYPFGGVIQGNYTAMLQAGWALGTFNPADTTLSQTGAVPGNAQSLQFRVSLDPSSAAFGVSLGGQSLTIVPLGTGVNYTLYGADIHSWAGQNAELDFTVFAQRPHVDNYTVFLDSIQFSNQSVPEPSVFRLSILGALLAALGLSRRRRRL